jgi:hypothetical protein
LTTGEGLRKIGMAMNTHVPRLGIPHPEREEFEKSNTVNL